MQQVNRAYEVLSDPMKKKLYDRYGSEVLGLYENKTITEDLWKLIFVLVNQKFTAFVGCVCVILFTSIVLCPIFIGLRLDGSITWSWFLVLFPLYIVEIFIVIINLFIIMLKFYFPDDDAEDHDQQQDQSEDGFLHEDHEFQKSRNLSLSTKISITINISIIVLVLLFQILLCLQLDQSISWSWWIIFCPLLVAELLYFFLHCPNASFASYTETLEIEEIAELYCKLQYIGFVARRLYKEFFILLFTCLVTINLALAPSNEGLFTKRLPS